MEQPVKKVVTIVGSVRVAQTVTAPILNSDDPDVRYTYCSGVFSMGGVAEYDATIRRGREKVRFGAVPETIVKPALAWAGTLPIACGLSVRGDRTWGGELAYRGEARVAKDAVITFRHGEKAGTLRVSAGAASIEVPWRGGTKAELLAQIRSCRNKVRRALRLSKQLGQTGVQFESDCDYE